MSALSERKPFAIDSGGSRAPVDIRFCLDMLKQLKELKDGNKVDSFMQEHAIRWYVVNPKDHIQWAEAMIDRVAFECGGYRVYHF